MSFTTPNYVLGGEATFRTIVIKSHPSLPDGEYQFLENYCTEPNCDCRKTIITIKHNGEPVGSIDYGWETLKFYKKWNRVEPEFAKEMVGLSINPLFDFQLNCNDLLDLVKELMDDKWTSRIKNTYRKFRREIDNQHTISKATLSNKSPSRNSPCLCGSGKKYKRCCIDNVAASNSQDIIPSPSSISSLLDSPAGYDPFNSDDYFFAEISSEVEDKVDQALKHIDKKRFDKAKNLLTPLLKNYPLQASVHFAMGVYHGRQDETTEAISYFEEAVNLLPNFVEAWHNLGQAYRQNFDVLGAICAARKVVECAEEDQHDQELAAQNQDFIDNLDVHIMEAEGLKLDDYVIVLENFDAAFIQLQKGNYSSAIKGFETVLQSTPRNQQTHGNIANCYANLGDKTKALYHIEKSLEIDPTYQVAIDNKLIFEAMTDGEPLDLPQQTVKYSATGLKPI